MLISQLQLDAPKIQPQNQIAIAEQKRSCCCKPFPLQICYNVNDNHPIPLKDVHYNIRVQNGLMIVEIQQQYSTTDYITQIELEYLFTINDKAIVTKMLVELGDIKVQALVKEKEEAKKEYDEGIKEGKTMAYCDQEEEYPELKRIKLGSLSPNKFLKIIIEYIQPLEVFLNQFWKIDIAPMIDLNYTKLTNQGFTNNKYYWRLQNVINKYVNIEYFTYTFKQDFTILLDIDELITYVKSPTHQIEVLDKTQGCCKKQMELEKKKNIQVVLSDLPSNFIANKQFTLLFSTNNINLPHAFLSHTNDDALFNEKYCATLTFIPKFNEVALDDAYQQYLDGQIIIQNNDQNKNVYLFFIDRSGSMAGQKIEKAKQSLILFLKSLPENCFFNIVSFGSSYRSMWKDPKHYDQENLDDAIDKIQIMKADMAGTEILNPFKQLVFNEKQKKAQDQILNVFLLTDGEVDPVPLIKLVTENIRPETRIYTLGIGEECSQYLIKRLSEISNAKYQFVSDYEDLNAKVIDLLEDSMTQYLQAFTLDSDLTNIYKIIPNPASVISLKRNQEFTIQVLFSEAKESFFLKLGCFDPQNKKPISFTVNINTVTSQETAYFHKIAAHKLITLYESSVKNGENQVSNIKLRENKITDQDIVNISMQYQILSSRTAFVCEVCDLEDHFKAQINQKIVINTVNHTQNYFYNDIKSKQERNTQLAFGSRGGFKCKNATSKPSQLSHPKSRSRSRSNSLDTQNRNVTARGRGGALCKKIIPDRIKFQQKREKCKKNFNSQSYNEKEEEEQSSGYTNERLRHQQKIITITSYEEILQFSQTDGSFHFQETMKTKLKLSMMKNVENLEEKLWNTLLALLYLEICFSEHKKSWNLVHQKGIKYLLKNGLNYAEKKVEYINKYRQII